MLATNQHWQNFVKTNKNRFPACFSPSQSFKMSIVNAGVVRLICAISIYVFFPNVCRLLPFSFQGAAGLLAGAGQLSQPAEDFGNDSRVEALWAMKAMEHAEVYFNVSRSYSDFVSSSPSKIF